MNAHTAAAERFMTEAQEAIDAIGVAPVPAVSAKGYVYADDHHRVPPDQEQVATAIAYLRSHAFGGCVDSYALRHRAQAWGRELGFARYVSHGALITAAYHVLGARSVVRIRDTHRASVTGAIRGGVGGG